LRYPLVVRPKAAEGDGNNEALHHRDGHVGHLGIDRLQHEHEPNDHHLEGSGRHRALKPDRWSFSIASAHMAPSNHFAVGTFNLSVSARRIAGRHARALPPGTL
jgi:hypothetical protein